MNKCDVTVKKQMTINTGNYSSIQPSVSITMKDVYVEDIEERYKDIEIISSVLLIEEIESLNDTQDDIKRLGTNNFLDGINIDDMKKDLKTAIERVSGIVKF